MKNHVQNAAYRALKFLERRQLPNGEFQVFTSTDPQMRANLLPDPSVFPTALVAQILGKVPGAEPMLPRALDFLEHERDPNGLWSHWTKSHPFHAQLPPDLDDTSCASAALHASGRAAPSNRELLWANRDARGRFYTWICPRWKRNPNPTHRKITFAQLHHAPTLALFFRKTSAAPRDVDAVVNANTLFYLGVDERLQPVVDWLLDILRRDGEDECDKWYGERFAIWCAFSRALKPVAPQAGAIFGRKFGFVDAQTPLQKALGAGVLLDWDLNADVWIEALLDSQQEDGAWPIGALYHGGRARKRDGSFAAQHPDTPHWGSPELSTAFALQALARWLQLQR